MKMTIDEVLDETKERRMNASMAMLPSVIEYYDIIIEALELYKKKLQEEEILEEA